MFNRLILILLLFLSNAITAHQSFAKTQDIDNEEELVIRDSITTYAQQFIGIPYKWGGSSTEGFDCTGFVYFVFKHFGIKVSRASSGYENVGEKVELEKARPGDIMLFTGTDASKRVVGHAGIVLKNIGGMIDFIHASSSKKHFGVTITRYNASGYVKRFLRVINVI